MFTRLTLQLAVAAMILFAGAHLIATAAQISDTFVRINLVK